MRLRLALGLLGLLLLPACGPPGPAIQEVSPSKSELGVAGDAPVRVVFNHEMDRASVASRLSLSPPIPGCDSETCPVRWSGRTMTLSHPLHQFAPNTSYRVRIGAGYRDATGQVESTDHFWDFRTEAAPTINAVSPGPGPGPGATSAAVDADFSVQLSRNVLLPPSRELTLTATGDAEPLAARVTIAPDDSRRLVLAPVALLRPHAAYTLHVGAGVSDRHHNTLGNARDFHFTTGPLELARSLAFLVRDRRDAGATAVAVLRPPAGLDAPAPSLRVLYRSTQPIRSYGWSSDSTQMYVHGMDGHVAVVALDGSGVSDSGLVGTAMAPSPSRAEVAVVEAAVLHLWRPGMEPGSDVALPQAGAVVGVPAWSGDGRRLAVTVDDGRGGQALRVIDRQTLSVSEVPGSLSDATSPVSWSADGAAVAFSRSPGEVWTYRPLTGEGTPLTRVGKLKPSGLAWSADGATLFASTAPGGGRGVLQRAPAHPLEGQQAGFTPLRGSRAGDSQPVSPTFDRRVAFVRAAAGVPQLWIINNDGTAVTQLTFASYLASEHLVTGGVDQPLWSPGSAAP